MDSPSTNHSEMSALPPETFGDDISMEHPEEQAADQSHAPASPTNEDAAMDDLFGEEQDVENVRHDE
jgi:hypothetical protein